MSLHDDPDDPALATAYEETRWFEHVLEAEYGERDVPEAVPAALNWLALLPADLQLGLDEAECSLAYVSETTGYHCALWEVSGEDDRPWLAFLVDDYGARLLPEYSVLDEDADDETLDLALAKASSELPDRLTAGEFDRVGNPVIVPAWLAEPLPEEERSQ
jgi:hypothetical protein